ncbi:TetR/AcrR family transcriptional regulator [Kineococcus glutinatus]
MSNVANESAPAKEVSARPRRRYDSTRRAEQAAETRRRIVEAAAGCFAELGYARTTLAVIARRAGVSPESVGAAGPKRDLLIAAFSHAFAGVETAGPLSAQEPWAGVLQADPPELAGRIADVVLAGQQAGIAMWRTVSAAATEDPGLGELYAGLARRRRADNLAAAQVLADRGLLRPERSVQQHADTMALLNGFDPYQLYVLDFGWSPQQLRQWYVDTLRQLVLAPPA